MHTRFSQSYLSELANTWNTSWVKNKTYPFAGGYSFSHLIYSMHTYRGDFYHRNGIFIEYCRHIKYLHTLSPLFYLSFAQDNVKRKFKVKGIWISESNPILKQIWFSISTDRQTNRTGKFSWKFPVNHRVLLPKIYPLISVANRLMENSISPWARGGSENFPQID